MRIWWPTFGARPKPNQTMTRGATTTMGIDWETTSSGSSTRRTRRTEAISTASFYRWRSMLEGASAEPPPQKAPSAASPTPGFVDLGTLRPATNARVELRLDLGGGVLLHLVRG